MKKYSLILTCILFVGCATINKSVDENPLIELNLDTDISNAVVVIYNHGTRNPREKERCKASYNRIPTALKQLENDRFIVYFLCSTATEGADRAQAGNQVYARMYEIEQTIDALLKQGISPGQIFLAGHSKGAWASLMLMEHVDNKFNAAILFAPALANRASLQTHPWWREEVRPKQIQQMLNAKKIDALIFAYEDDEYNRPEDLKFLTDHYSQTVTLIAYRCDYEYTHNTHLHDCRSEQTKSIISRYIEQQILLWNR